jgi:hypothetical protein
MKPAWLVDVNSMTRTITWKCAYRYVTKLHMSMSSPVNAIHSAFSGRAARDEDRDEDDDEDITGSEAPGRRLRLLRPSEARLPPHLVRLR